MEDDWLEACTALNGDCLHASHVGDDPADTFNDSDSSGGDGDDGGTATLSCAMDSVDKPAICDSTANISYAVPISNRFSSLPIEQASVAESTVEELSTLRLVPTQLTLYQWDYPATELPAIGCRTA